MLQFYFISRGVRKNISLINYPRLIDVVVENGTMNEYILFIINIIIPHFIRYTNITPKNDYLL